MYSKQSRSKETKPTNNKNRKQVFKIYKVIVQIISYYIRFNSLKSCTVSVLNLKEQIHYDPTKKLQQDVITAKVCFNAEIYKGTVSLLPFKD